MQLYYPKAKVVDPPLTTVGPYERGYPRGAVVHFTAGAPGLAAIHEAQDNGYTYFVIDEHGDVYQGFPLDRWGRHAGVSRWPGIGDDVSKQLVGIEIVCAGKLSTDSQGKYLTWYGRMVPISDVRVIEKDQANQIAGPYQKFTATQELALMDLLVWLKLNGPDFFDTNFVVGHDEVSRGRKTDPGGSLSMTMPQLREKLARAIRGQSG